MTGRVALSGLAFLIAAAAAAPAQSPTREQMRDAERAASASRAEAAAAARRGEAAEQEELRLAEERVAAARRVQQADGLYDAALERQRVAGVVARAAEAEAARRARAFTAMLPVLRRLAMFPTETLLAVPAPPEEALRGALVLRSLARHLRQEAAALRLAREAAAAATATAEGEQERAGLARAAAREAAAALDVQVAAARARRAEAADAGREAAERAQAAAARATDIQEMLARLERETAEAAARTREEARRRAEPPPRRVALARPPAVEGPRAMPVAGRIARDFGDATDAGPARGVTISAPPGARVVSPCAGRAVFSGPFRSYGQLLIIDCGDGSHLVLAGLERLDAATGARVLPGEPVGVLGEGGAAGRPSLYLELRRNGQPADPRPWLAARS